MEYRTGDHYGLNSRVVEIRSQANRPEELLKYLVEPPADYDPQRHTARIRGAVVVPVEPPPGAKIAWVSAEGSFATHQMEAARRTRNTIAWAVDVPQDFQEVYRAQIPPDAEHWHCNAHREIRLDEPARRLYLRYVGDPALNNFHVYAHCVDDGRPSAKPVTITHVWREPGGRNSQTVTLARPGPYEIVAEGEPECESMEIRVPSDGHTPPAAASCSSGSFRRSRVLEQPFPPCPISF